jgi:hypothetical protein
MVNVLCLIILPYVSAQNVPWTAPAVSLASAPVIMNCIPQVNGQSLEAGDYIGIFNESGRCFGLSRWKDTINFRITVYGSDGTTDGFKAGDTLLIRLWLHNEDCTLEKVSRVDSDKPLIYSNSTATRINVLNFERASVVYPLTDCCLNGQPVEPLKNYSFSGLTFQSVPGLGLDTATGIINPSGSEPGNYVISLKSPTCLTGNTLNMNLNDYPRIESMPDTFICGDKLEITVPFQQDQVQWSTGAASPSVDLTEEAKVWYKVTNNKGCSNSDTFGVKKMTIARLEYGVIQADCQRKGRLNILDQEILNGKAPYKYNLTNQIDNLTTNDLTNITEGIYQMEVINSNGCALRYQPKIVVEKDCLNDKPVFSPNEDGLDDRYFINLEGKITIFDRNGSLKRRLTGPCYFDGNDENGHPLPMGVYMVISEKGNSVVLTIVR